MSKKNMSKSLLPKEIIESAQKVGIDTKLMLSPKTPKFFLNYNKITAKQQIPGLILRGEEIKNGIKAKILVKKGVKIKMPVHLCFGMIEESGEQIIIPDFVIEDGAEVLMLAHCSFPKAKNLIHKMEAKIKIGKRAKFLYEEYHYHGENSGAHVFPKFEVENRGSFETIFTIDKGTVGELVINADITGLKDSVTKIVSRVLGRAKKDKVEIYDRVYLKGENATGLTKMRAAAIAGGRVFMQGAIFASATGARGHVDCQEIVVGKDSWAKAVPIIEVSNEQARVTHEASVGKVNQIQLETLMTRGLSEEEAVDMIIKGLF